MLPGFRALLAAIALTFSIVVFGLGAAALLRASHERFANLPALRVPETVVAARPEPSRPMLAAPTLAMPTLAMLRVEPPAPEPATPVAAKPDDPPPAGGDATMSEAMSEAAPDAMPALAPPDRPESGQASETVAALTPQPSERDADQVSPAQTTPAPAPLVVGPEASMTMRQAEVQTAILTPAAPAIPGPAEITVAPAQAEAAAATGPAEEPAQAAATPALGPPPSSDASPSADAPPVTTAVTTAALEQPAPESEALPPPVVLEGPVPVPKSRAAALAHPTPRPAHSRKRRIVKRTGHRRVARRAAPATIQQQQQQMPSLFPFR